MKYNLTNDDLKNIYLDNFENIESVKLKTESPLILLCSIIIAFLYVQIEPANGSINGTNIDIFIIYIVQFPLCFIITYAGLEFFRKKSLSKAKNKLKQKLITHINSDDIGERELIKENGYLVFKAPTFIYHFKPEYITGIKERENSYSLLHGERTLFSVPKRICSLEELKDIVMK